MPKFPTPNFAAHPEISREQIRKFESLMNVPDEEFDEEFDKVFPPEATGNEKARVDPNPRLTPEERAAWKAAAERRWRKKPTAEKKTPA